jgi:hypothetical protein
MPLSALFLEVTLEILDLEGIVLHGIKRQGSDDEREHISGVSQILAEFERQFLREAIGHTTCYDTADIRTSKEISEHLRNALNRKPWRSIWQE